MQRAKENFSESGEKLQGDIIRSIFLIFAIYRSNVNTSLKNKICFENIYFRSKFIKLCPESLKEHTDKISLRLDETQTFY